MATSLDNFQDLEELGIDVNCSLLDENFTAAANHVQTLAAKLSSGDLLSLYGFYKQSTEGCCNAPKPSWYDTKGCAKWKAWQKLGDLSKTEAKSRYVELVRKLDPQFDLSGKEEQWVRVSTLLHGDDDLNDASVTKTVIDFVKDGDLDGLTSNLKGKTVDNSLDESGLGLIHWAADLGSVDILHVLLGSGADLNLRDCDGQTALHFASSCGHLDAVKFLLERGADSNCKDNDDLTPLEVAGDDSVKKLLS